MSIQSGTSEFHKDKNASMIGGSGPRTFTNAISFKTPYAEIPTVTTALTGFDILNDSNSRISVFAKDVTADGFTLVLHTWNTTKIWSASVTWMAYSSMW